MSLDPKTLADLQPASTTWVPLTVPYIDRSVRLVNVYGTSRSITCSYDAAAAVLLAFVQHDRP